MESPAILRRRRPAKSCLECRRRKVRCNREEPCNNCMAAKRRCAYQLFASEPIYQHHSTPSSSQSSPFQAEIQRPNATDTNSGHAVTASAGARLTGGTSIVPPSTEISASHLQTEISASHLQTVRNNEHADGFNGEAFLRSTQDLGQTATMSSDHGQSGTLRGLIAQQVGMHPSQLMLMKSRIMKWSHLIFIAKEVRLILWSW